MIPFSDDELYPVVKNSLEKIRPMLNQDGGDLKFIDVKSGKVFIELQGACHGCAASGQTLKYGIERQLRIDIHPEMEVISLEPGMSIDEFL